MVRVRRIAYATESDERSRRGRTRSRKTTHTGLVHRMVYPLSPQLSLILINRPRRDGTLSWHWYTAAASGIRTRDRAVASPTQVDEVDTATVYAYLLRRYVNANRIKYCANCTILDYNDLASHTSVIREHYVFLLETLDVKWSGLVGQLYSDHVISAVEIDDISAEQTSFRANEKLLSVLSRKSPRQFQLFLDALDNCGQRHVRNVISHRSGCLTRHLSTVLNRN